MGRVFVRLYGLLASAAGAREIEVDASGCSSVRCVLERASSARAGLRKALEALDWDVIVLLDGRRVSLDSPVAGEGVMHVMPPASGGSRPLVEAGVLRPGEDVDLDDLITRLSAPGIGAIAIFVGIVRSPNRGEDVEYLEYDYDPQLTPRSLEEIAAEEAAASGVRGVIVYHYVGRRTPGERTMIVAVGASTRREAFRTLQTVVDRVKREALIWKTERRGGRTYYHVGDREIPEEALKGD